MFASGSVDNKAVKLWDVQTGSVVYTRKGEGWVFALAFSPDGRLLASGGDDMIVRLWNVQTGSQVQNLVGHSDVITAAAFSPDGMLLASGSEDKTVKIWRIAE